MMCKNVLIGEELINWFMASSASLDLVSELVENMGEPVNKIVTDPEWLRACDKQFGNTTPSETPSETNEAFVVVDFMGVHWKLPLGNKPNKAMREAQGVLGRGDLSAEGMLALMDLVEKGAKSTGQPQPRRHANDQYLAKNRELLPAILPEDFDLTEEEARRLQMTYFAQGANDWQREAWRCRYYGARIVIDQVEIPQIPMERLIQIWMAMEKNCVKWAKTSVNITNKSIFISRKRRV